jgi:hypothetical protein
MNFFSLFIQQNMIAVAVLCRGDTTLVVEASVVV